MGLHNTGYLFREGIKSLWKNRTMSIASIAVLIACLLLTGVAGVLTINLSAVMATIEGNNTLTVFLQDDLPSLTAVKVGEDLRVIDNISECKFKPKDVGLSEMMQLMGGDGGDGMLFNTLQGVENPLPDAYEISLADLSKYDETIASILSVEGVDRITNYKEIADKLSNLDRLVRYCSVALVAVLGVVSLFIISNTVKVTMFSRRTEINIMKSVGATNWFVRVPFIVEGVIIGLISGGISAAVLLMAYDRAVIAFYSIVPFLTAVDIHPYVYYIFILYAIVGASFGLLGGSISIGKYLNKEGENAVA